jgi:large subunit ribosomal protein L23
MATTKKTTKKAAPKKATKTAAKSVAKKEVAARTYDAIISPRITEKAAISAESNAYIFNVKTNATKSDIAQAVEAVYKVVPVKVTVVRYPGKQKFARGKWGKTAGGKKAYVFLKKGDQIQII